MSLTKNYVCERKRTVCSAIMIETISPLQEWFNRWLQWKCEVSSGCIGEKVRFSWKVPVVCFLLCSLWSMVDNCSIGLLPFSFLFLFRRSCELYRKTYIQWSYFLNVLSDMIYSLLPLQWDGFLGSLFAEMWKFGTVPTILSILRNDSFCSTSNHRRDSMLQDYKEWKWGNSGAFIGNPYHVLFEI